MIPFVKFEFNAFSKITVFYLVHISTKLKTIILFYEKTKNSLENASNKRYPL